MVYREMPKEFDFNEKMEALYPRVGAEFEKESKSLDRVFFRGHLSTINAKIMFDDVYGRQMNVFELEGSCSESCELYPTEEVEQ